jgi:2-oxoglutarate ferredoxin oxidoreductase subunit alpha
MSERVEVGAEMALPVAERPVIVNDFSMVVATVNGSGSQTSNSAILRALFRMGIPVSGKNLFPSNIQGLPTWFTIRVSASGNTARKEAAEILVAMNQATLGEDLKGLRSGGVCFYADHFVMPPERADITYYPIPVRQLVREVNPPTELRDYIANMAYVGVAAVILGIDLDEVRSALETHFQNKTKPIEMNMSMVLAAAEWARSHLTKHDRYRVERSDLTRGKILVDGNTSAALGAIYGGLTFAAWYPITPASSLAESLQDYLPVLRTEPETGKATYSVIQAEDEIAAVGMAVGAGWAGARAMTSTSGPGLSLMTEYTGLAFFAEVPLVIWDVQRMGPSTGLPTRTSQGDITFIRFMGHGDTKHIMLLPATMAECFEFGWRAFDLAERMQTPVFVLSDLDLGMNLWMSEPYAYPDVPMDRGKVLAAEDLERVKDFARYRDVDGDGIPYRTLPGTPHPKAAYFARGTGHNERTEYSERPEDWTKNMERLWRKMDNAVNYVPAPVVEGAGSDVGIVAFGSTDPAIQEARSLLASQGMQTDYLRLRSIPFTKEVEEFVRSHTRLLVIEMNVDGQMRHLLQLEYPEYATRFVSLKHNDGLPLTAEWVVQHVRAGEEV